MNPAEKFREAVRVAITAATAAGVEKGQLHAVLLELAGFDRGTTECRKGRWDRQGTVIRHPTP